jgi:hypothetical protein
MLPTLRDFRDWVSISAFRPDERGGRSPATNKATYDSHDDHCVSPPQCFSKQQRSQKKEEEPLQPLIIIHVQQQQQQHAGPAAAAATPSTTASQLGPTAGFA